MRANRLIVLFVSILALCNSPLSYGATSSKAAPGSAGTPVYGGTMIIRHQLPTSLGWPARQTAGDTDIGPIVTDTLVHFDERGKPAPWLATSWKYSPDMKSLTFTLRQGVKFHDNTDFNAAAVKANLDACKAVKRGELASVSSVDVVDNYTVRLNLSKFDAYLLSNLAEYVGVMISPAALAKGEDFCRTHPVGTGPFKLVSFESGIRVKFEKWEGYWQKGKPYLDAVEVVQIPDEMTAGMAITKGEVNVSYTRDVNVVKGLTGFKVVTLPAYLVVAFDSAHKDSPFSDLKVRQAVAYAIDNDTFQKTFGKDLYTYDPQMIEKTSLYYNKDVKGYPYNLEKAKELLAASSYPKGFKMNLWYPSGQGDLNSIFAGIQFTLAKIGIEVALRPIASAAVTKMRADGWQNGGVTVYVGIYPEKDLTRSMLNQFSKYSMLFKVVARSPEYDAILDKIVAEPDFDKRVPLNQQLMKQMVDGDCLIQTIFNIGWLYVQPTNLNGDHIGDIWLHQSTPQDAWFAK